MAQLIRITAITAKRVAFSLSSWGYHHNQRRGLLLDDLAINLPLSFHTGRRQFAKEGAQASILVRAVGNNWAGGRVLRIRGRCTLIEGTAIVFPLFSCVSETP